MDQLTEETLHLRRCVRELAALSVLSAAWGRTEPPGIAASLAEVLLRSLPAVDFVYARVKGLSAGACHEAVRAAQLLEPPFRLQDIGKALGLILQGSASDSYTVIPNPVGEGRVKLAVIPIGYEGDCGVLVAGSQQPDFPGAADQLLLGVAANQAAVVLHHQRSQQALREQSALLHAERELLRVTLASIGDAVITTDAGERVTFLNPVAEKLTGWTTAEATGLPVPDIFPIINERTRQQVQNPAQRALREGLVVGLANHTLLIARDGTERPIDDSAAPIRDGAGRAIGAVLVFRDITERKRAEEALAERVRLLALSADVGMALTQSDTLRDSLQRCAGALVEHLDGAFARIWTLNPEDNVLELQASAGLYTHLDGPHSRVPVGEYKIGQIAQERMPYLTNAVQSDSQVPEQEWAMRERLIAFAGYPLVVEDRLLGVMAMFARHRVSDATLAAMAAVANGIASGIERKQAQERLREQQEWLRVTLASIGDAVVATDTEGRVTFLNPVAQDLTGWTTNEAQGQPLEAVFRIVQEHTREPVENPVAKVLRDGRVVGQGNYTVLIARDGTERPIDDSAAPMRDEAGVSRGAVLVFRDVTERRSAELSRTLLASIVDASDDAIVSKTLEGVIRSWNLGAERLFGYTANEAVGRPVTMIIPPELVEEEQTILERLRRGERIEHFETTRVAKDGRRIEISLTVSPLRDEEGRVVGASKVARDITDRKRAEAALREADRRKDEFLALLAHELRNTLAPLRNGLQVLRLAGGDTDTIAETRTMMDRQLDHMVRFIDDLLDMARIGQNKIELRRTPVPLTAVIDSAAETARPVIEAQHHELNVTLPAEPLFLDADLTRLTQVLSNLLTNSAKYTRPRGQIWFTAEREGEDVVVAVRDTGIGIPADALPRIFDMFSQVDRSTERSTGGLGIGLALVKGLVEMHGGTVTAESPGPGRGSTFTVRLPTLVTPPQPVPSAPPRDVSPAARSGRHILVVDDNRDSAKTLSKVLKLLGHEVDTAHDAIQAFESARELRPEVILMDVAMPGQNGYDATRLIREQPWGRYMIIIALTGWGQEDDRVQSMKAGCDGHLVKPVNLPDLQRMLAELTDANH